MESPARTWGFWRANPSPVGVPIVLRSLPQIRSRSRRCRGLEPPNSRLDTEDVSETDVSIVEGVSRDYCTDFICTSSPSVEQTVKAFAVDLERQQWTLSRFGNDVEYKDPYRSFSGVLKYKRMFWAKDNLQDPRVAVKRLKMKDKGTAIIDWNMSGQLGILPIDVDCQSVINMNLLTGRILSHRDSWDLSRCSPPTTIAFNVSRWLWSAKQSSADAKDTVDALSKSLPKDEDGLRAVDGDPTKFFFEQDNTMQEALLFATGTAILYLMYRAWAIIFKI